MITSFRHDNERKAKRKKILGILLCTSLLLLIFRTPVSLYLSNGVHIVARPLLVVEAYFSDMFAGTFYFFASKQSLAEENARLTSALDLVLLESYSREMLRRENEELKSALLRHEGKNLLVARVLASPGVGAPYDSLVIDVGESDGLALGTRVFIDGDFVIGEITQLFMRSAVVTLYSSSGNEIAVTVGTSSIPTIAYGVGGGNFRIVLPRGLDIVVGDIVDIPSLSLEYAGVVDAVRKNEGSSLQDIFFKLPINMHSLRFVYILAPESMSVEGRE